MFLMNLYGREIEDVLGRNSVSYETIISHDSERDKSFENLEYLCETLVHGGVTKKSIVLSFGGGCLTNVVGLAAGILYRGIRYVEMTTTFMAMTDSSLSNRQAVNGRQGETSVRHILCADIYFRRHPLSENGKYFSP